MPETLRFPELVGGRADGKAHGIESRRHDRSLGVIAVPVEVKTGKPWPEDLAHENVHYRLELLALPAAGVVVEVYVVDEPGERTVGHGTALAAIARRACR